MRRDVIPTVLLVALLTSSASAGPYAYTVLSTFQTTGVGQIDQSGRNLQDRVTVAADPPDNPTTIRGYGGWLLPTTTAVSIKEAWVIAKVTPLGDPLPNPVNLPLELHFITGSFDAGAAHASISDFNRLNDGPLVSLPPARRESGNLVAVPFSSAAITWLEGQRFAGMNVLNLGFTEQAGGHINVALGSPYILLNPPHVLGDANGDGIINNLDIAPFATAVVGDASRYESLTKLPLAFHDLDVDFSGSVNNLDIVPFVTIVAAAQAVPEPHTLLLALLGSTGIWAARRKAIRAAFC